MLRKTRAVLLPSRAAAAAERRSRLPILFLERCDFPAGRDFSKKNLLHVSYYQQLKRIKVMRNRSFTMVTGSEGGVLCFATHILSLIFPVHIRSAAEADMVPNILAITAI